VFVRHVMTRQVYALSRQVSCRDAYQEFRTRRIRRAPVVEHGQMVGIVTLHDLLHVLPGTVSQEETQPGAFAWELPVDTIMHYPVRTLHPNDHLETAARLMLENRIGALPVVRDDEIVGILTESDIFRALWGVLSSGKGWRVILEEPPASPELDYATALGPQGGKLESLIRFPMPEGGSVVYLRSIGGQPDTVVQALRACGVTVLQIDRN